MHAVCLELLSQSMPRPVVAWVVRKRLYGAMSVCSWGKKGRIQLAKSGLVVLGDLASSSGRSMSIDVIDDLLLETPLDTSSGVEGGVDAGAGRPKKVPKRS